VSVFIPFAEAISINSATLFTLSSCPLLNASSQSLLHTKEILRKFGAGFMAQGLIELAFGAHRANLLCALVSYGVKFFTFLLLMGWKIFYANWVTVEIQHCVKFKKCTRTRKVVGKFNPGSTYVLLAVKKHI